LKKKLNPLKLNKVDIPESEKGRPSSSFSNSKIVQYPSREDNARYLAFGDLVIMK